MTGAIFDAFVLMVPLIVSGIAHMIVVRLDLLPRLRVPVHRKFFGPNKTWRGFIVMPLATIPGVLLASAIWPEHFGSTSAGVLGALLGLGYAVAELPNSFLKRRLGVAPGKRPERRRFLFTLLDQADSGPGCALVYLVVMNVPAVTLLAFMLLGPGVHLMANFSLYLAGLRKEPV